MRAFLEKLALVLAALAVSGTAVAQQLGNVTKSPVVVGDNAKVDVKYDESVTNHIQHKHVTIYNGPAVNQVTAILNDLLQQNEIKQAFQAQQQVEALGKLRDALLAEMKARSISTDGIEEKLSPQLDSISDKLDEVRNDTNEIRAAQKREEEQRNARPNLFLGAYFAGVRDVAGGRGANGLLFRIEGDFVIAESGDFRALFTLAASGDGTSPDQFLFSPTGVELERKSDTKAYRLLGNLGLAAVFQANDWLAAGPYGFGEVGAQWFSSTLNDETTVAIGGGGGASLWFGAERSGVRFSAEYAAQSARSPVYRFSGLDVNTSPKRETHHNVRLLLGGYLGL